MSFICISDLPTTILESIIGLSDPAVCSLVSSSFNVLACTSWVKSEWVARQYREQPPLKPVVRRTDSERDSDFMVGLDDYGSESDSAVVNDPELGRDHLDFTWDNGFLDDCDKIGNSYYAFPPYAHRQIRIPHNARFLDLKTLQILRSRHLTTFTALREFLLCNVAFFYNEPETLFMLDSGAPVDYARGWVLARFTSRPHYYHRDMLIRLLHDYHATPWHSFGRFGASNALIAVLVLHDDPGELARELAIGKYGERMLANEGYPAAHKAVDRGNLRAVRFLMDLHGGGGRDRATSLLRYALIHARDPAVRRALIEEYGAEVDRGPEAMQYVINEFVHTRAAAERREGDFEMLEWYFDALCPVRWEHLVDAMANEQLFEFLCGRVCGRTAAAAAAAAETERETGSFGDWPAILRRAVRTTNFHAVRYLLESGLCSVHDDGDAAVRSLFDNASLAERFLDHSDALRMLRYVVDDWGADVHAGQEEPLRKALAVGVEAAVGYILSLGTDLTNLPTEPWADLDDEDTRMLIPVPHGTDLYLNTATLGLPRMGEYEEDEMVEEHVRSLYMVMEEARRQGLCQECRVRFVGPEGNVLAWGDVVGEKFRLRYDPSMEGSLARV